MNHEVWVLTKEFEPFAEHADIGRSIVIGVYPDYDGLAKRIKRIAAANPYPLTIEGRDADHDRAMQWRCGPEEHEGFFGNAPVWLTAHPTIMFGEPL